MPKDNDNAVKNDNTTRKAALKFAEMALQGGAYGKDVDALYDFCMALAVKFEAPQDDEETGS
jgi:hypothetical protein